MQRDSSFTAAMIARAEHFEQMDREAEVIARSDPADLDCAFALAMTSADSDLARMVVALARRQDTVIRSIVALQMYNGSRPLAGRDFVAIVAGLESMVDPRDLNEHRGPLAAGDSTR